MTAQEAFDAASKGGSSDLRAVLTLCGRHGGYCVIGGLAVNTYVQPVYTMDADIVIATERHVMSGPERSRSGALGCFDRRVAAD